jgi:hypothetical protein
MTGLPFIVFDVNETLLDLESLTPTFERIFGERSALRLWFTQLILYSEALTLAGAYVPFTDSGCGEGNADAAFEHMPGRLPHLGHFGCGRGGLAGRAYPAAGQRAPGCRTSATDYRRGPQRGCRQADRPLRQSKSGSAGLTRLLIAAGMSPNPGRERS